MAVDLAVAKLCSMVVLGFDAFVCIFLPIVVDWRLKKSGSYVLKSQRSEYILNLCLSFGGGVLLCTTFLHLLPEVTESVESLQNEGKLPKIALSIPELIMCCGFFIMYIVEEVVHQIMHSVNVRRLSIREGHDNPLAVSVDPDSSYKEIVKEDMFKVAFSPPDDEDVQIIPSPQRSYSSFKTPDVTEIGHHHGCHQHDSHVDHDHQPNESHGSGDHHHHHHHVLATNKMFSLRELLIVLALTVHESFEGAAIGLENTVDGVWYLMAAVAVHKSVIAFCIGIELVSGQLSTKLKLLYTLIFSIASPLGIGVGFVMSSSTSSSNSVPAVILQGIATGTLLYVVFFEVLKRENDNHKGGFTQMAFVILGFVIMAVLMVLVQA